MRGDAARGAERASGRALLQQADTAPCCGPAKKPNHSAHFKPKQQGLCALLRPS